MMNPSLIADLARSGLGYRDLNARELSLSERTASGIGSQVDGYTIPYYDIKGLGIPFYRVKLIDSDPKYKQPIGTSNFIYFPPNFSQALGQVLAADIKPYIILTEGEKKAAKACKEGYPCIALGGVYSWKTRVVTLPEGAVLETQRGFSAGKSGPRIKAKLPRNTHFEVADATLAAGLPEIVDLCIRKNICLIIIYDSDRVEGGVKMEVQTAAALLGYDLRFRGVALTNIRQLILPSSINGSGKMGLDDYLVQNNNDELQELIIEVLKARSSFPKHPNSKYFINAQLQGRLYRRDTQKVSLCILSEMDASGKRLVSSATKEPYYFNNNNKNLMRVNLLQRSGEPLHETGFGIHLYQNFGLTAGDTRVLNWLASQFTGEEPIDLVLPKRVIALSPNKPDHIAYQISDSKFAMIGPDPKNPIQIFDNGSEGLLFEQGQVEAIDEDELLYEFKKQSQTKFRPYWIDALKSVNIRGKDKQKLEILTALLYYISPWLSRWRGCQLPIELIVGEAGSGKTSLCQLRLSILTGNPIMRNAPNDLRDWHASILGAGGMHVTDNVQFVNAELRQRLSDEICRIVTAPNPHIEMRKLYTSSSQLKIPVDVTFTMTAIQQPFHNVDLLQRAFILDLEQLPESHDSDWVGHQLMKQGGRITWLAHHFFVLHKFMKAVAIDGAWDTEYRAGHRLSHYEQALIVMADVIGVDAPWISEILSESTQEIISESDWAMEGLKAFSEYYKGGKPFTTADIANWAVGTEDYSDNSQLSNARRLGKYMQGHKSMIVRVAGIKEFGLKGNRRTYKN